MTTAYPTDMSNTNGGGILVCICDGIASHVIEKSYIKYGGKTITRPFSKKIKIEYISQSIVYSFIQFVFIVCYVKGY